MKLLLLGGCGYVGSAFYRHVRERFPRWTVDSVDLQWWGCDIPENMLVDYRSLHRDLLEPYDAIVLLAGHSSVAMCEGAFAVPALENNVMNFARLLERVRSGQRLVYASSVSVYGAAPPGCAIEWTEAQENPAPESYYDLSMIERDKLARLAGKDVVGLRFGTVNGPAPNLRVDVMLNKMVHSAKAQGRVEIANPEVSRPILGIRDLCHALERVLTAQRPAPGIYNVASFNATVDEIGRRAAKVLGTPVRVMPATKAYDMRVDTGRFERTFDFEFLDSVESIVEELVAEWPRCRLTARAAR